MAKHMSAILGGAAALAMAGSAAAQMADASPEELFSQYYESIAAYERCVTGLSADQHLMLDDQVMTLIGGNLGAGTKLSLIEEAKRSISQAILWQSCSNGRPAEALARFESDLRPAAPELPSALD